jgi:hypothetical protein
LITLALRQYRRAYPEAQPPDEASQAEIDRLTAATYDALVTDPRITSGDGEDPSEAIAAETEALSDKIDALSRGTQRWAAEDIARAGVVIGIGHAGRLAIERGRPPVVTQAERQSEAPAASVSALLPCPALSGH